MKIKEWKQSTDEWIKSTWYTYTMEIMSFTTTMDRTEAYHAK